jgi:hypothetical protein
MNGLARKLNREDEPALRTPGICIALSDDGALGEGAAMYC